MRLQYCGVHDDCQIVDNQHVPKHDVSAKTFPDWPPSREEFKRGTPDSELMPRLSSLEEQVADAVGTVAEFQPVTQKVEGALKSLLDRADKLVRQLDQVEQGAGLSAKAKKQLETIAAQVERQTQDWKTFVASHTALIEGVKTETTAVTARLAEGTRRELVELRSEQAIQAEAFNRLSAQVVDYAASVPDGDLVDRFRALPGQVKALTTAVAALGERQTKAEQNWTTFISSFDQAVEQLSRKASATEGIAGRTLTEASEVRGVLAGQSDEFRKLREDIVGPEVLADKEKLESELAEFQRLFKEALSLRTTPL